MIDRPEGMETTESQRNSYGKMLAEGLLDYGQSSYGARWHAALLRDIDRTLAEIAEMRGIIEASPAVQKAMGRFHTKLNERYKAERDTALAEVTRLTAALAEVQNLAEGQRTISAKLNDALIDLATREQRAREEEREACIQSVNNSLVRFPEQDTARHTAIHAIRALPLPPAADGWRTIESAPKDGTRVLLYLCTRGSLRRGWAEIGWWGEHPDHGPTWKRHDGREVIGPDVATHWMPLPSPPAEEEKKT